MQSGRVNLRLYSGTLLLGVLLAIGPPVRAQYALHTEMLHSPNLTASGLGIPSSFKDRPACTEFLYRLPGILRAKGFAAASIDSVRFDSAAAWQQLYLGEQFAWSKIKSRPEDAATLKAAGWSTLRLTGKPLEAGPLQAQENGVLDWMENNGYPFAKVWLDSVGMSESGLTATVMIDKGPLYHIDSIRINGSAHISSDFIGRYLNIPEGSIYRKERLLDISRRLRELPYLQEEHSWKATLLGTGSILDLYLKPRKSSQVDVLVGFLPNNDQLTSNKLLVTGEATANFKNPFGNGESIGFNWQQLQQKSPRLNISFQQPYLFHSSFGVNAAFSLYKKDSAFITTTGTLGIQFTASPRKVGTVFIQSSGSSLITVDTLNLIASKRLPEIADVSSVSIGASYDINTTNYRFNPVRGNELVFTGSVGTKKVRPNAQISKLTDPDQPDFKFSSLYDTMQLSAYQFRLNLTAAHYFPLSRASTLRLATNAGWYQSPNTFRNELFQIGGYRLLRGFDEESILASHYATGTLEYRYLIGLNSYLFAFYDGGWAGNNVPGYKNNSTYMGLGIGMAFETKAGIFNISYAIGKQDSDPFAVRKAKIHLGYINFF